MDTVPGEILNQIFCFLPNSSLCCCSLVCRSWNTVVTSLLYGAVILPYGGDDQLFSETIYSPDKSRNINMLVKEIHFWESSMHEWSYPNNDCNINFANQLRVLPNLQTMIGYNLGMDTDMAGSKSAEKKLIKHAHTQTEFGRMMMITKNHNKINGIAIVARNDGPFQGFNGILECLQLYPCIRYLIVDYREIFHNQNDIFVQILYKCPKLEYLFYGGLNTDHLFETRIYTEYPSMNRLTISINELTSNHIKYIGNTFPNLEYLSLNIYNTAYNKLFMTELVNTFIHLDRVEWELMDCYTTEETRAMLDDLWTFTCHYNIVQNITFPPSHTVYWTGNASLLMPRLSYGLWRSGGSWGAMSVISTSKPDLFAIYEDHDESVTKIIIGSYPNIINLNVLNQAFHNLNTLELHGTSYSTDYDGSPVSNTNLFTLNLPTLSMTQGNLDSLYMIYPKLKYLISERTAWDIPQKDFKDGVYTIINQWTKLHTFRICSVEAPSYVKNIVVARVKKDGIRRIWVYNTKEQMLKVEHGLWHNLDFIEKPIIVFETKAIGHVYYDNS